MSTLASSLTRNHRDFDDCTLEDRTYVNTKSFYPANDPTRLHSRFIFFFKIIRRYYNGVTQAHSANPQAGLTDHEARHEFSLPFRYLIGDSGQAAVAGMLAGIRAPFRIDEVLFWKGPGTYRAAERMTSLTDVVARVSGIADHMIGEANGRRTLILHVTMEKRVVVMDRAYRTLMENRPIRCEETLVNRSPAVNEVIQIAENLVDHSTPEEPLDTVRVRVRVRARECRSGGSRWVTARDRLGRASQRRVRSPESRVDFMAQTWNDRRSDFTRSVPEARSPEHGGSDEGEDGGERLCVICLEDLFGGSEISWMPCSHGFHSHCIAKWLETSQSHNCPICRCRLRLQSRG